MKTMTTRRTLLMSILSLVMCVAMLIGTTFAWFTDSVTSGRNTIQSGNLDVVLEYWDNDKEEYVEVTSETKLFNDAALWEPGHTEVAYLKVSNAGSLALKYQLNVNVYGETIGKTKDNTDIKLSDYLVFSVVDKEIASSDDLYTRETAIQAAGNTWGLKTYNGETKALEKTNDADYVALIIYMPTSVGNEANHNGVDVPSIELGVNLVATQYNNESDSFGTDFDKDAWGEGFKVHDAEDLQSAINAGETYIVLMEDMELTESIVIPASTATTYSLRARSMAICINLNGKTLSAATGNAIINYGSVIITNGTVKTETAYAVLNKGTMTVEEAVINGGINNSGALTVESGTVKTERGGYSHAIYSNGGSLVINGGTFIGNGNEVINSNSDVAEINGGTFRKVDKTSYLLAGANMVINDGTFLAHESNPAAHPIRPDVTVNGGNFNYQHTNLPEGYSSVKTEDGTYVVLPGENLTKIADGLYYDNADTYYVTNASGLTAVATEVNKVEQYAANIFDGKVVKLVNDINLGGVEWAPIGNFAITANDFSGTFDGQGHTVSNFVVTEKSSDSKGRSSYGLFGNVTNGTVKNLTVENARVNVVGGKFAGALIGRLNNGSTVENCHVMNSSVSINNWQVGGLVGQMNEGNITIKDCSVKKTTVSGYSAAGILVGYQMGTKNNENTIEGCVVEACALVQNGHFSDKSYDLLFGVVLGYHGSETTVINVKDCVIENTTVKGVKSDIVTNEVGGLLIVDGVYYVPTAEMLSKYLADGNTVVVASEIKDATIKLPAYLKNVTIKATEAGVLKNTTVMASDGTYFNYEGLTFDGVTFDNSRISITGWRNQLVTVKDFTVTNCVFKNLDDTTSSAPIHFNMGETEPVYGFTFTNNIIDGATGGSKSGIYAQVTGKTIVTGNVINNVAFRPYVIQVTTDDGIADEFVVTGNTFSGSATGRAQGLGNNSEGTDTVKLVVSNNIFKDITNSQQICYWNFNPNTTTAELSKNYYSIDIVANPGKIYYNAAAEGAEDLVKYGIYPFYTELNADGTINLDSLVTAP